MSPELKKGIPEKLDILDKQRELPPVTVTIGEKQQKHEYYVALKKLLRDAELKWRQGAIEI